VGRHRTPASSGGEGVRATEADDCSDGVVELVARIAYTSDFSEPRTARPGTSSATCPGLSISDVEAQGLSSGDLLDDGASAATLQNAVLSLPRLAAERAGLRARGPEPNALAAARGRPADRHPGQRLAARAPRPAGLSVGAVLAGLVALVAAFPRGRGGRPGPAAAAPPAAPPSPARRRPLEQRMTLDLLDELVRGVLATLAYAAVGTWSSRSGYVVLDAITPGQPAPPRLRRPQPQRGRPGRRQRARRRGHRHDRDRDVRRRPARGVADALVYGLLGIALLAASFKVLDRLTPGDLGQICTDPEGTPAVYVTAAFQVALGAVLAAAIS
jgi:hypothetical protein